MDPLDKVSTRDYAHDVLVFAYNYLEACLIREHLQYRFLNRLGGFNNQGGRIHDVSHPFAYHGRGFLAGENRDDVGVARDPYQLAFHVDHGKTVEA
jgi:hypothetical protein